MRVLMFGWEFPPHISGGLGTACFGLTKSLSKLSTDIIFVLPKAIHGPRAEHLTILGTNELQLRFAESQLYFDEQTLKFIKVDSILQPYSTSDGYDEDLLSVLRRQKALMEQATSGLLSLTGNYGPNLMSEVSRYAIIGKYLGLTEHFDIIHAHDWMTFLAGVEAKLKSNKPLVVHVHATEFDRSGENVNQEIYDIERYGMVMADRIIAVSHRTKQTIIDRYHIDPNKIDVVHNAIVKEQNLSRDQIQKNLNEKIVLFLGRITMQKGPEYFIEAARIVLNQVKNVRFVMAGSGDLLPRMIERMAELKLLEHFHFTGFLDGERRERMYAMSDLFVMPSVSEPFGLTPIEAMLYNVPVIVSKQSGVSEVLQNAIKVDFWDVQKLADSMIDVLTNTETAKRAVEGIPTELKAIDWDDAAWKVISTYKQLIG